MTHTVILTVLPSAAHANRSAASANARTSAKTSSALCENVKERTVMSNETHAGKVFEIEKCRAKINGAGDLVDCLALEQASICGHSLPFGYAYFCKHLQRLEFVEKVKIQALLEKSQSDNQE